MLRNENDSALTKRRHRRLQHFRISTRAHIYDAIDLMVTETTISKRCSPIISIAHKCVRMGAAAAAGDDKRAVLTYDIFKFICGGARARLTVESVFCVCVGILDRNIICLGKRLACEFCECRSLHGHGTRQWSNLCCRF